MIRSIFGGGLLGLTGESSLVQPHVTRHVLMPVSRGGASCSSQGLSYRVPLRKHTQADILLQLLNPVFTMKYLRECKNALAILTINSI
jgi:hypothetical protein